MNGQTAKYISLTITNIIIGGVTFPISADGTYEFTIPAASTTGGIVIEVISSFNDQDYLPYESMWARGFAHEHTMTYELTREEELLALSEMI